VAESLFTSQTPAVTNADNGSVLHVGMYFTPAVDGTITKARWYPPTTSQSDVKAALYRTIDSVKVGADVTFAGSVAGPGWVEVSFAAPVTVAQGVQYAIVVRTPRYYTATTGASSPWPLTNGNLSTPSTAGRFNDDDNADVQMVATAFNNGNYFVDVVFVADGEAEPETGTVAATLPALVAAAEGTASSSGTVAQTLPALVVAGAGSASSSATLAAALPALVAAAEGSASASGSMASTLPALVAAVRGVMDIPETSSPTSALTTSSRPSSITTSTRARFTVTGSAPGGS
jgi:hypothetical protein